MNACDWMRHAAAVAALWTLGSLSGPARADDPPADDVAAPKADAAQKPADDAADKAKKPAGDAATPDADKAKKPPTKDRTASAFKLPRGATLNASQQQRYDQLKAGKKDELEQAIDDFQKSGKNQDLKKLKNLKQEIQDSIQDIIDNPDPGPPKGGSDSSGGTRAYWYDPGWGPGWHYWGRGWHPNANPHPPKPKKSPIKPGNRPLRARR